MLGDELIHNNLTATDKSPEDLMLQSEEKRIQRLLLKLNEYERTILILRDYESLS